ncbi:translation initiation factor IF-2-like [Zalophus californianus]|uniref:Translation initiation factor IF-2-like n=1 Tax=Zalophus californianus TaxID=9704 RepID=A0A6J2ELF4_ZALCA|nr:translation initiation factor IF-2-like [Zalophus californianus]
MGEGKARRCCKGCRPPVGERPGGGGGGGDGDGDGGGRGGGEVPEAAPRLAARRVPPGECSSSLLPASSSSRPRGESSLPRNPDEIHLPRSVCRGLTRGAAEPGARAAAALAPAPGAAATRPPAPAPWRGSPAGGLRRAGRTARSPPSAAPRFPTPWRGAGGGLTGAGVWIQRTRPALSPPSSRPGAKGIFPRRGAGGGVGAAAEASRGCGSPARNHSLPLRPTPPPPSRPGALAPWAPRGSPSPRRARRPEARRRARIQYGGPAAGARRPPPRPVPARVRVRGPSRGRSRGRAEQSRGSGGTRAGAREAAPWREGGSRRGRGRRDVEHSDARGPAEASGADGNRASPGALGAPPVPHVCSGFWGARNCRRPAPPRPAEDGVSLTAPYLRTTRPPNAVPELNRLGVTLVSNYTTSCVIPRTNAVTHSWALPSQSGECLPRA